MQENALQKQKLQTADRAHGILEQFEEDVLEVRWEVLERHTPTQTLHVV